MNTLPRAAQHWAKQAGKPYISVVHDDETGFVTADAYATQMTADVKVTAILHTSPVTGMAIDVASITNAIRAVAPDCFVIIDGIQHASHGQITESTDKRARIEAAGGAIKAHEKSLTNAMLLGAGNLPGLTEIEGGTIIGGQDNPSREGLVRFAPKTVPALDIIEKLNQSGIRTHIRKADHCSGNILNPLDFPAAVRVSMCHHNSIGEVAAFLTAMKEIRENT